uniref:Receptor expression-enhancing protein 3-B n=1 Tax=Sphaerodactylus townsendi TaxID=933632 RepID=A0ACB8F9I0_9SAUR
MMYWIVFALYTITETIADLTISWFPLYYELKIAFVIWLLSPYTRGASLIYRKFLHPLLSSKEKEIDEYIVQAKERGYETMVNFGKQGLNLAATAAVTAAVKLFVEHGNYNCFVQETAITLIETAGALSLDLAVSNSHYVFEYIICCWRDLLYQFICEGIIMAFGQG